VDTEQRREAAEVNLGQARNELEERGFHYLEPSRLNFMLNRALTDLEAFYLWPWQKKTVTGAAPLVISDLKYVRSVYDSTGNEMFGIDDDDDVNVDRTGSPENWWIDDTSSTTTLRVYPVGNATLTVRYIATDAVLSADSDTPNLPDRYSGVWIDLAVVRAYHDSDNFAAAQALDARVRADLQQMLEQYETRNRMNTGYIRILAGSEDD
jgi:hypothetical protein